eukprot:gene4911-3523_t
MTFIGDYCSACFTVSVSPFSSCLGRETRNAHKQQGRKQGKPTHFLRGSTTCRLRPISSPDNNNDIFAIFPSRLLPFNPSPYIGGSGFRLRLGERRLLEVAMLKTLTQTVATAFSTDPLKEFKINKEKASVPSGRHGFFQMSEAVERGTGKLVTIFSVKRRDLVLAAGGDDEAGVVVEKTKRSVHHLSMLTHPSLLHIERPLTVSGSLIFYVTERVKGTLHGADMNSIPMQVKKLELQHCIEAMRFLHARCNVLLLDFGPHTIYMTPSGWKIGDISYCIHRNELHAYRPLTSAAARRRTAPVVDYMADECLETPSEGPGASNILPSLFDGPAPASPPSLLPHSDIFSFLVTAAEVLLGRRMLRSGGNFDERRKQIPQVSQEIAALFPVVQSLSIPPRPDLAVLSSSACISSPEIRVLLELEHSKATMHQENISFDILKAVYDNIGNKVYCMDILQQVVVPFVLQAAKFQRMLRFILPMAIQCVGVMPIASIPPELRGFFLAVLQGIVKATSFEAIGTLAQQLLEKISVVEQLFASIEDQSTVMLPFYLKCAASPDRTTVLLSLRALNRLLGVAPHQDFKLPPGMMERLILLLQQGNEELFKETVDAIVKMIPHMTEKERSALEAALAQGLRMSLVNRPHHLPAVLTILQRLHEEVTPEHLAVITIPLLAPLLLSSSAEVRNFVASVITNTISKFDVRVSTESPARGAPGNPSPSFSHTATVSPTGSQTSPAALPTDLFGIPHVSPTQNAREMGTTQGRPAQVMEFTAPPAAAPPAATALAWGVDSPAAQPAPVANDPAAIWSNLAAQLDSHPLLGAPSSASTAPALGSSLAASSNATGTNKPDDDLMKFFNFTPVVRQFTPGEKQCITCTVGFLLPAAQVYLTFLLLFFFFPRLIVVSFLFMQELPSRPFLGPFHCRFMNGRESMPSDDDSAQTYTISEQLFNTLVAKEFSENAIKKSIVAGCVDESTCTQWITMHAGHPELDTPLEAGVVVNVKAKRFLTEEERAAKVAELKQKAKEMKAQKAEEEHKKELERIKFAREAAEAERRRKEYLKEKELRDLERAKAEDAVAKQKIQLQLRIDRLMRGGKEAKEARAIAEAEMKKEAVEAAAKEAQRLEARAAAARAIGEQIAKSINTNQHTPPVLGGAMVVDQVFDEAEIDLSQATAMVATMKEDGSPTCSAALELLKSILLKIVEDPLEKKKRMLSVNSPAFNNKLAPVSDTVRILRYCNFEKGKTNEGKSVLICNAVSKPRINTILMALA